MAEEKRRQRENKKQEKAAKAVALALAISVLFIETALVYRIAYYRADATVAVAVRSEKVPAAEKASPADDTEEPEDRLNILVLGMDSNSERLETGREDFRTDTMLLVSINFDAGSVDMISIPRDSYVAVTKGTGTHYKVNAAAYLGGGMCSGGFENACDTVSGVFGGVAVDYYAAAGMDGLVALMDALGGVYYDVSEDVAAASGLDAGFQLLDGSGVLAYCRARKGIGTDVDRQQRQQEMLLQIFEQQKSAGKITDLPDIYLALKDMIYTNLSFTQIVRLAQFFDGIDDMGRFSRYVLEGEYHWAYGVYYYLLDQQAKADLTKEVFGEDIVCDTVYDIYYVMADSASYLDVPPTD